MDKSPDLQTTDTCSNCGHQRTGKYCSACGEKVFDRHERTFSHFIGETFHALTHADGKIFKALMLILINPGLLSEKYTRGKRQSIIKPVSLFFVCNLIFFLVPTMTFFNRPLYGDTIADLARYSWMEPIVEKKLKDKNISFDSQNVGYIDTNDWMAYRVNVPASGAYTIQYRVASANGGGSIRLEQLDGNAVFGTIAVPSTGGWQTWTTISHTVQLPAGKQDLALVAAPGGFNINWFSIAPPFSQTIQAESYSEMLGVQTENTTDTDGGLNVGWIDTNEWLRYNNITIPATGSYELEYRVASPNSTGVLSQDLNSGTKLGTIAIPNTGGLQNWTTISKTVTLNAGTYNFGIFAVTGGWNINWWRISAVLSTTRSLSTDEFVEPVASKKTKKINPRKLTQGCTGSFTSLPATFQAENFCQMKGIQTQTTTDSGPKDKDISLDSFKDKFDAKQATLSKLMMILFVPAMAVIFGLINLRKKEFFADHVVIALEFTAFLLFYVLTCMARILIGLYDILPEFTDVWVEYAILSIWVLTVEYFLFRAQRKYYQDNIFIALTKTVFLSAGLFCIYFAYDTLLFLTTLFVL